MKYNLSEIMHKAWKLYRKGVGSFAEALHRAWNSAKAAPVNAQRIEKAQQTAGVAEQVNTWTGWKTAGRGQTGRSRGVKSCTVQRLCFKWFSSTAARGTARLTAHHSLGHLK